MKAIVTVLGKDRVGIIARVSTYLAERNANVLEITQTIVQGYFNMLMIVDIGTCTSSPADLAVGMKDLGEEMGLVINLQREEIFECMHRV